MTEENIRLFDAYLNGSLATSDKSAFEKRLQDDSSFANSFWSYKEMVIHLELRENHSGALAVLKEERGRYENSGGLRKGKSTRVRNKTHLFLLLAIILAGVFAAFYLFRPKKNENMALAKVYQEPAWPMNRGGSELGVIMSDYFAKDKAVALENLKNHSGINSDEKNYWLAELYAHEWQADSTLKYLELIENKKYKRDRILFLQSLSFAKKKDMKSLDVLIISLPSDIDPYYRKHIKSLSQ